MKIKRENDKGNIFNHQVHQNGHHLVVINLLKKNLKKIGKKLI